MQRREMCETPQVFRNLGQGTLSKDAHHLGTGDILAHHAMGPSCLVPLTARALRRQPLGALGTPIGSQPDLISDLVSQTIHWLCFPP